METQYLFGMSNDGGKRFPESGKFRVMTMTEAEAENSGSWGGSLYRWCVVCSISEALAVRAEERAEMAD